MFEIIDFILHISHHLQELVNNYGAWIYLILFLILFCETGLVITPFLPGDSLLFAAGSIAAVGGMNVHFLFFLLITAAIVGDGVNFFIGKYFGERLFANNNSKIFRKDYLNRTHEFYEKYGGRTIILARFIPIIRSFAPFVAGMGKMDYGLFIRYNAIGGIIWVGLFCYLGYFFGQTEIVKRNLALILAAIIVISILPPFIEYFRIKWLKKRGKN
ncbi:MAG: DedA family protein [Cardiobacteriaceae bacterium]|nr:DedA family protein [Cardiobacteriaceae bacterium]